MGQIVNLRTKRKQAARDQKRILAASRAALHGRSAAQKHLEKALAEQACKRLDGHERET